MVLDGLDTMELDVVNSVVEPESDDLSSDGAFCAHLCRAGCFLSVG